MKRKENLYFFNMENEIGELIKEARMKKGLSQGDLAKLTGINRADISKYETGYRKPLSENLLKIVRGLDMKL